MLPWCWSFSKYVSILAYVCLFLYSHLCGGMHISTIVCGNNIYVSFSPVNSCVSLTKDGHTVIEKREICIAVIV